MSELDQKVLDRVRKLLAKAEHPGTPVEEAQAFSAKASALMAAYAIDQALVEAGSASSTSAPVSKPIVRQIEVDPPYAMPRAVLLDRVARAHRVRVVIGPDSAGPNGGSGRRQCTLVGFPVDLDVVEVLFTSLLLQASTAMLAASRGRANVKAFRRAFLFGYAAAIGRRLREVQEDTEREATAAVPGSALVLVDRKARVDAAFAEQFPRIRSMRATVSSGNGLAAGQLADATADLSARRRRVGGQRGEIGPRSA
jgi:hypothetical protein